MGKASNVSGSSTGLKNAQYDDGSPDGMRKNHSERVSIQFANTFIGQALLIQFEKMLWSLEKTAAWISNNKTAVGRKSKSPVSLIRPLPWILFLPTLVVLRYTRVILSLAAICMGFEEIEASTMVTYLHNSRRSVHKLRKDAQNNITSQSSTTTANRSKFYPEIIGKALVNGLTIICTWPISTDAKVHNNKTLLDLNSDDILENGSNISDEDDDTDDEDLKYRELLTHSFAENESEDEDYVCDDESSAESANSSNDENSFFEEGEIDALKEDIKRSNGREIVLVTEQPFKTNGENNETEPIISEDPNEEFINNEKVESPTNNHNKNNGKKPIKHKFTKGKSTKNH